jgi:Sec-independent protein translocase protein TatA
VTIDAKARPLFQTARNLGVSEGLTISVAWPKGLVEEPGALQKFTWLLSDNLSLLIVLAGLLLMLIYYLPVWRDHGKDPEPGVLFARYEPPKGFSPASLRYIEQMYYDDTSLTAAVVSLAVKGYLRIIEDDDEHSLLRIDPGANPAPLATGEKELHDALFEDGDMVILDDEYHELLGGARSAHERSLKRDYKNRYFKTNGMLNLPALFIGITASIIAFRVSSGSTILIIAMIVLMVLVLIVFAIIMRRPTGLGRRLLDEVGGFKEYMEIAEKDEMNLRNPPHKTPELFEQYLPFALAMGVEQQWGERFAAIFARIKGGERFAAIFARIKGPDGGDYQPSWYKGSWNNFDMSSNTTSLSSGLGTAISSSVTPPGSSSGGGGGGFSGGGGGGGGGGGW